MSGTNRKRLEARRRLRRWKWANLLAVLRRALNVEPMDKNAPLRYGAGKSGW